MTGARSLLASSQLTGVDQKSRRVLSFALRQCCDNALAMESSACPGGFQSWLHICRIATIPSFPARSSPRVLLEMGIVIEFRKNLLPISDVAHLNRDRPWRL